MERILGEIGTMVCNETIDFVIYWVDGNDKRWQKKRQEYCNSSEQDNGINRYRDWDNLQYLFRGIEKFAPWVNKIYFISDEQVPFWLNEEHPKVCIIDHKDYIPEQYLPVFSSHPIELNLHRIPGLSEKFVVFNDDCFLTNYVKPEDFFDKGLPKDIFMEYPIMCGGNAAVFSNVLANDFNLIGKYFSRKEYKRKLRSKILTPKYGMYFFYNLILYCIPYPRFFGLLTPHFSRPYLKSSFLDLWDKEGEILNKVCMNKFRDARDVNIYIFRLWNLLKGEFVPGNIFKMGHAFFIHEDNKKIYKAIKEQKYKVICLNDDCTNEVFNNVKDKIKSSFAEILPEKSVYEK